MAAGKGTVVGQREMVIELVANDAARPLRGVTHYRTWMQVVSARWWVCGARSGDNDENGSRGWRPWSCARCRRLHTAASFLPLTFSFFVFSELFNSSPHYPGLCFCLIFSTPSVFYLLGLLDGRKRSSG
ncbi:hypothetical protein SESBI_42862 [Sesbania bispinosa]|nr:hypothetical protein SESBI_42862 [Sesbania bispinosa]